MLEGLDSIDWASLEGGGGPAADVPDLLRALASGEEGGSPDVWAELCDRLWHQGTVYPAAAAAIPFLYELLARPDFPDRGHAVELIAAVAAGEAGLRGAVRRDGEAMWRRILEKQNRSLDRELAEAEETELAVHAAVSAGLPHLLPYLTHPEHRLPVAHALARFPEHASRLVPAIDAALSSVSDPQVRRALAGARASLVSAPGGVNRGE